MNLAELQDAVAEKSGLTKKDASSALTALITVVGETLKSGDDVRVAGLGVFAPVKREARKGRNPATGQEIDIPPSTKAGFKAAKALNDSLKA